MYSLRVKDERRRAAQELAAGKPALFYLGLYTAVKTLRPPQFEAGAGYFWTVKPSRPVWSKLPMVIRPRDSIQLADFSWVHPAFQDLKQRERWAALWVDHGAPLHVIAPVRKLRLVHPAFQTSPEDLRGQATANPAAADRVLPCPTASFFWMEDPDWHDLALRVGIHTLPNTYFGGTSFNDHGEHPPYTFAELERYIARRPDIPFDLVISDDWFERAGIHSSHTMIRIPLRDEPPEFVMTRRGSVSPEFIERVTGRPVRALASTATASSQPGLAERDLEHRLELFRETQTRMRQ